MNRFAVVLGVCVCANAAQGGTINLITDTEMPLANWSAFVQNQGGGFTFGVSNPAAGGNPGAYRGISHASTFGPTFGTVTHLHAVGWNPMTQGAITSLDMSLDVNCFNGGTSGAVGFGLIVEQGGTVFFGPTFTPLTNSGWRTDLNHAGLSATDFANGAHPDFTAAGAPIRFGFYSSNGTGLTAPISSSSGADNFVVRLVPAPGVGLMLATLLAGRRRRRSGGAR